MTSDLHSVLRSQNSMSSYWTNIYAYSNKAGDGFLTKVKVYFYQSIWFSSLHILLMEDFGRLEKNT